YHNILRFSWYYQFYLIHLSHLCASSIKILSNPVILNILFIYGLRFTIFMTPSYSLTFFKILMRTPRPVLSMYFKSSQSIIISPCLSSMSSVRDSFKSGALYMSISPFNLISQALEESLNFCSIFMIASPFSSLYGCNNYIIIYITLEINDVILGKKFHFVVICQEYI